MTRNSNGASLGFLRLQALGACLFLACLTIAGAVCAAALPKGNCADPTPYTDLRHCNFARADLTNKDLSGADLRVKSLYGTLFGGANLTNALYERDILLMAELDGVQGLPQEILSTFAIYSRINNNNYLVTQKGKSISSITLASNEAVQGTQENIAGLASFYMVRKAENESQTMAMLDWPRNSEGQRVSIVARFDKDKLEVPACYQTVSLLKEDRYYYPHWGKTMIRSLGGNAYLIGVMASGSDGDGESVGGWHKIAFLKLSSDCSLSILHQEESEWLENPDGTGCQGKRLDFDLVNDQSAAIKITDHICRTSSKAKAKTTYKKIKLN
jgi:Pentapeptide repeats (8 copies)